MEEFKKKILAIIDQFKYEETGNKLSQFSMQMLRIMIENEFNQYIMKESKDGTQPG